MSADWEVLLKHGEVLGVREEVLALCRRAEEDLCAVAFLGEFSRGKSSLVNALLGEPLLPVDVRPTTAGVVSIQHGAPVARMHDAKGVREVPLDAAAFRSIQTVETGGTAAETPGWLEVKVKLPLPLQSLRLIDTPGVNDMEDTSPRVLYRLLPRVDLAVFVLDASEGVHRSEETFIREHAQATPGVPVIVYANKFDRVDADEEEELDDVKADIVARLRPVLGGEAPILFGTSKAFPVELVEAMVATAQRALSRRRQRLLALGQHILRDALSAERQLLETDESAGHSALERLSGAGPALQAGMGRFRTHVRGTGEGPLGKMVDRSLDVWADETERELVAQVHLSRGNPSFAEHGLTRSLEKQARAWVDRHTPSLRQFLARHALVTARQAEQFFATDGLAFTAESVLLALTPYREQQTIELAANAELGTAARYGMAAAGGVLAGLVASGLSPIGFVLGLALAENLRKQKEALLEDQLLSAIPGLIQNARRRLFEEVQDQLAAHFDRVDFALQAVLTDRLARVDEALRSHQLQESSSAPSRAARHETLDAVQVTLDS